MASLSGLWGKFIPLSTCFFFLAFANTIVDNTKDTLVITALGGGADVIPFLTVYGVLPASVIFLVIFAYLTSRLSRERLFYAVVGTFTGFFALFALVYPYAAGTLHPHGFCDYLASVLPAGFAGLIAVVRNWTYSIFYIMAELWGDVCISLLFWGMANELCSIREAEVLYPLFGVGANLSVMLAGFLLRYLTDIGLAWGTQLTLLMASVAVAGVGAMAVHHYVNTRQACRLKGPVKVPSVTPELERVEEEQGDVLLNAQRDGDSSGAPSKPAAKKKDKNAPSLKESLAVLSQKIELRCLAVLAVGQGISYALLQVSVKGHLHMLFPNPGDFSRVMGDVSSATGACTALLMVLSPIIFTRFGWRVAALVTPLFMMYCGSAFLIMSALWHFAQSNAALGATWLGSTNALGWITALGAAGYVFLRASKFALFKPAEEMVYIGLDSESRTKGKAAIDVVGAQFGKSGGSMLQQGLLILMGTLSGALPAIVAVYIVVVRYWTKYTHELADVVLENEEEKQRGTAATAAA
uniref:ADP,ATP carrier protein n=1 Tax=Prasinoderma singulare TaxID=676789 RepID=A0A7S3FD44_9VIRI